MASYLETDFNKSSQIQKQNSNLISESWSTQRHTLWKSSIRMIQSTFIMASSFQYRPIRV